MKESYISDEIKSKRILSHGKIENLADGFEFPNGEGFSLYARPKENASIDTSDIVLSVKCVRDENPSDVPIRLYEWSTLLIESIESGQNSVLESVDLYWGCNDYVTRGKCKVTTPPTEKALTYSGEAQELVNAGVGTGQMQYKLGDAEWSTSIPTATNVAVYDVLYKCVDLNGLRDDSEIGHCRAHIAEKFVNDPTIELSPSSFTYSGEACVPTVVVKDGTRVIPSSEYTVELSNNINAGTANVNIVDNIAGNYDIIGSTTFTIAKANAEVTTAPTAKTLTYNGSAQDLVNAGVASGGQMVYSLDGETFLEGVPAATTAGAHTVYYKVIGDANHNDTEGQTVTVTIAKATRTMSFTTAPKDMKAGESMSITAVPSLGDGAITYSSSNTSAVTVSGSTITAVAQGETTITATIEETENCLGATVSKVIWAYNYLTFVAKENGTFSFTRNNLDYSLDGGETWTTLTAGESTPTVSSGSKIMWKGVTTPTTNYPYGIGDFNSTGNFDVEGNVLSIYKGDSFANNDTLNWNGYTFNGLFSGCTKLKSAENLVLPSKTLKQSCYKNMFYYCTSLTTAPLILATTMAESCYESMFTGCTSLVNAPARLSSGSTVSPRACAMMFNECTSLTTAPELPAASYLSAECYSSMFNGCTSLVNAPAIISGEFTGYGYSCANMFSDCTKLETAPVLPALTLNTHCYMNMFKGCTKLKYIKAMFTTEPSDSYTDDWVKNVAASGTFVKNSAAIWDVSGVNGIPNGWTVQTASE